jgi:excisionase family DNA binding protein
MQIEKGKDLPDARKGPTAADPVLTSSEAASILKIHPKTLQKMARAKEIPGFQIGKLWRFRLSAVTRWLDKVAS